MAAVRLGGCQISQSFSLHLPILLRAKRFEILDNVGTLEGTARAENKLDKLHTVVVGRQRRVRGEDSVRDAVGNGLVDVEQLVDHKAERWSAAVWLLVTHCPNWLLATREMLPTISWKQAFMSSSLAQPSNTCCTEMEPF